MSSMNLWVTEQEADHVRTGWAVTEVLFSGRSEFQTVDVVETKAYGTMLLLDGLVMITDADEFIYHEMISHIPLCLHPNPKRVLVIGGGDGGTVREILKHKSVEEVILCEIDDLVIEQSKRFFPQVANCLKPGVDPRVKVRVGDGVAFIKELKNEMDVILVDSTDPIGPGEGLFSREFYRNVAGALKQGGLMAAQSESPWFTKEALSRIHRNISGGFKHRRSYVAPIPTYPRGSWSWTIAAQELIDPAKFNGERFSKVENTLQYLSRDLMTGAFALPRFYLDKISDNFS
ncbi:MAG: polyamine aminopropyltransferase [bacterium]|jgi:spermidine synthase